MKEKEKKKNEYSPFTVHTTGAPIPRFLSKKIALFLRVLHAPVTAATRPLWQCNSPVRPGLVARLEMKKGKEDSS